MPEQAINCRPAHRVTREASALASRRLCRVPLCGGVCVRCCIPARGRGGSEKCPASATCVHDRVLGERRDGRWSSSSVPGYGPTSGVLHDTLAGRTKEPAKKLLLRDHAPPQSRQASVVVAEMWYVGGHVLARRAWPWRHRPDAGWLAVAPPASAGAGGGIRGLGSNVGSNAAAGTCVSSLCASRRAAAVVADGDGRGRLDYPEGSPRERLLPRDSPGRMR
jgi:hypothetical protein